MSNEKMRVEWPELISEMRRMIEVLQDQKHSGRGSGPTPGGHWADPYTWVTDNGDNFRYDPSLSGPYGTVKV